MSHLYRRGLTSLHMHKLGKEFLSLKTHKKRKILWNTRKPQPHQYERTLKFWLIKGIVCQLVLSSGTTQSFLSHYLKTHFHNKRLLSLSSSLYELVFKSSSPRKRDRTSWYIHKILFLFPFYILPKKKTPKADQIWWKPPQDRFYLRAFHRAYNNIYSI